MLKTLITGFYLSMCESLFVSYDLANRYTDMVLLYNKACYRSREGL